jgi:hypothetical protein
MPEVGLPEVEPYESQETTSSTLLQTKSDENEPIPNSNIPIEHFVIDAGQASCSSDEADCEFNSSDDKEDSDDEWMDSDLERERRRHWRLNVNRTEKFFDGPLDRKRPKRGFYGLNGPSKRTWQQWLKDASDAGNQREAKQLMIARAAAEKRPKLQQLTLETFLHKDIEVEDEVVQVFPSKCRRIEGNGVAERYITTVS